MSGTRPAVQVEGLRELTAKLRLLDDSAPKAIRLLNKAEASKVVPPARALAEQLFSDKAQGTLEGTIRAGATQRAGYIAAGSSAVLYAGPQHFGWPKHKIGAHPFLTEALGGMEAEIVQDYERGIGGLIAKAGL